MKKSIITALSVAALLATHCKKEAKNPEDTSTPAPSTPNTPGNPSNPSATSNNGLAVIALATGNWQNPGKMIRVDLGSNTSTDLNIPYSNSDAYDVAPDGDRLTIIRQYAPDTLVFLYSLGNKFAKKGLLLKNSTFSTPNCIHFNKDGSKILFLNNGKIYSLDPSLDASQTPQLVSTLTADAGVSTPLTWNTDATKVIATGYSGSTNTSAHNICYFEVETGKVTQISNGIITSTGKEVTYAQSQQTNGGDPVISQNGYYYTSDFSYRGWTSDGNIYYYSNRNSYHISGQPEVMIMKSLLYNMNAPEKTETAQEYTSKRIIQYSWDGSLYVGYEAFFGGNAKVYKTSDNSVVADLSSVVPYPYTIGGIRFAAK